VKLAYDGLEFEAEMASGPSASLRAGEWRVASEEKSVVVPGNGHPMQIFGSAAEWAEVFGGKKEKGLPRRSQRRAEDTEKDRKSRRRDAFRETRSGQAEGTKIRREGRGWHEGQRCMEEGREKENISGRGSVIAIGNFDGIHLGHRRVLEYCIGLARETGAVATALTFEPPPLKVLRPEAAPLRISTNRQRMKWFEALGVGAAVVLPFTMELARLTPEDFVEDILVRELEVKAVAVGDNFRFGHKQAGNVKFLRELGMRNGFEVIVHDPVKIRGEIVSSTLIRKLVAEGDVMHAARLLGRPFVLTGEVVPGTGTGRKFTFPTLNLRPEQELLPARGVYITRTVLDGETSSHRSVTNVGMRPTFDGTRLVVETHLLDYSGSYAPKRIEIRFWKKLREEKKFSGAEELKAQIAKDIGKANAFFDKLRGRRKWQEEKSSPQS
jgi:riboflavin kinase / FMN adenylyltransferase